MTKLILDGYNIIYRVPQLRKHLEVSLEDAREALIEQLKMYIEQRTVQITLVFDAKYPPIGTVKSRQDSRLRVVFSTFPLKADPVIKNLVVREKGKRSLTIVTDDRDILDFAKSHGARTLSPGALFERMTRQSDRVNFPAASPAELSDEELAEWMEIFGLR